MKFFCLLFALLSFNSFAQTGKLVSAVDLVKGDDSTAYNVILTSKQDTFEFKQVHIYDTLDNIAVGEYRAFFYCCDSNYLHQELIAIGENSTTYYEFISYSHHNTYPADSREHLYQKEYPFAGYKFGMGLPTSDGLHNSFTFGVFGGIDLSIARSPVTWGMEYIVEYHQSNYGRVDLFDPSIYHDKQRFSNFNLSWGTHFGLTSGGKKIMDIGARYHLPLVAKFVQVDGDVKTKTRRVHQFTDVRLYTKVGFWLGFIYMEYRPLDFLKDIYPDTPRLNFGIRINMAPIDGYY